MKRLILTLAIIATPTQAFEWPWTQPQITDYAHCMGFVSAGLGEFPVQNLSRTQLWLSWNKIIRSTSNLSEISETDFQSGHDHFEQLLAANDIDGLLQVGADDCGLARN